MRKFLLPALALGLILLGSALVSARRQVYGNPLFERRMTACDIADKARIRVYEGNAGATTAYWYTVTADRGLLAVEKQFLFAYGIPVVDRVTCSESSVVVTLHDGMEDHVLEFSLAEIEGYLRSGPLAWRMGEKLEPAGWPMSVLRIVGLAMILLGALLFLRLALRRRSSDPSIGPE